MSDLIILTRNAAPLSKYLLIVAFDKWENFATKLNIYNLESVSK